MTTYTNLTIASKYNDEDESFIATGANQAEKDLYRALIASVVDTNGKSADIVPGIGKQYIAHENYFQIYCPRADFITGIDSYGVMSPRFNEKLMDPHAQLNLADENIPKTYGSYKLTNYELSITNYLNWVALGGSRGALAGAAIRSAIIQEIDIKRECNIVKQLTAEQTKGLNSVWPPRLLP